VGAIFSLPLETCGLCQESFNEAGIGNWWAVTGPRFPVQLPQDPDSTGGFGRMVLNLNHR